jgi:hypothetical protein
MCQYCKKVYKSEKVILMHFKKTHEKLINKLDKKLTKKAKELFK